MIKNPKSNPGSSRTAYEGIMDLRSETPGQNPGGEDRKVWRSFLPIIYFNHFVSIEILEYEPANPDTEIRLCFLSSL